MPALFWPQAAVRRKLWDRKRERYGAELGASVTARENLVPIRRLYVQELNQDK